PSGSTRKRSWRSCRTAPARSRCSRVGSKSPMMRAERALSPTPPRSCGSTCPEAAAMSLKRVITEFGTGNDLHGGDYTKAAVRAVQDAIHHSSLTLIRTLGVDAKTMQVEVTVGVQQPARVDLAAVKAALPHGEVTVKAVKGGLDIPDDDGRDTAIIATAAVTVRIDLGN